MFDRLGGHCDSRFGLSGGCRDGGFDRLSLGASRRASGRVSRYSRSASERLDGASRSASGRVSVSSASRSASRRVGDSGASGRVGVISASTTNKLTSNALLWRVFCRKKVEKRRLFY